MLDTLYNGFAGLVGTLNDLMYSYVLIILLLAAGVYFTIRTAGVQVRLLGESVRVVSEKSGDTKAVSAFEALMVSTASRVGTGNIVGVANAIAIGGYGSVFWMWLIALVGGATAFVESTLAQIYKKRSAKGGSYGGPSYYIQAALGSRSLGIIFAIALIATYAVGFNMLASFNLIDSMSSYHFYDTLVTASGAHLLPIIGGALLALLVGICIFGNGNRIVKVTGVLVPVMGVLYIIMALIVMVINAGMLPEVLRRIFAGAFDFKAIFGGAAGFGSSALMQGIKRGLYSNEAGVGSAPNAAAAADVSHPVKQGLVQMLSVFIDTILVCTATAMMCLCTGIEPSESLKGAPFVQASLEQTFGSAAVRVHDTARQPVLLRGLPELYRGPHDLPPTAERIPCVRLRRCLYRRADEIRSGLGHRRRPDGHYGAHQPAGHPAARRHGDARAVGLYEAAPRGPEPGIQGEKYRAEGKDGLLELTCNRPQTVIPFLQQKPYQRCTICRKTKALTGCTAVWWA